MTTKANRPKNVTANTALTAGSGGNTGGDSGNYFDSVGSNFKFQASELGSPFGPFEYELANPSLATNTNAWSSGLTGTQRSFRFAFRFKTSLPPSGFRLCNIVVGAVAIGRMVFNSSNQIQFQTNAGATTLKTFVAIVADHTYVLSMVVEGAVANARFRAALHDGNVSATLDSYTSDTVAAGAAGDISAVSFGSGASTTHANPVIFSAIKTASQGTALLLPLELQEAAAVAKVNIDLSTQQVGGVAPFTSTLVQASGPSITLVQDASLQWHFEDIPGRTQNIVLTWGVSDSNGGSITNQSLTITPSTGGSVVLPRTRLFSNGSAWG